MENVHADFRVHVVMMLHEPVLAKLETTEGEAFKSKVESNLFTFLGDTC